MQRFGRPCIASWGPDRVDVFLRSRKGALIHIWRQDGATFMLDMGGQIASDPVAVTRGDRRLDVFARDVNQRLLWWTWSEDGQSLAGPQSLPGFIVTDPIAVALGGAKVMVFARSIDGPLRYWTSSIDDQGVQGFGRPEITDRNFAGQPAIVSRTPNSVDVIVAVGPSGSPECWEMVDGLWRAPVVLGGAMPNSPAAVTSISSSGNFPRIDVYSRGTDQKLIHWGRGYLNAPGSATGWYGPEASVPQPVGGDPVAISTGVDRIELLARDNSGSLVHWSWDLQARQWRLIEVGGDLMASDPAAISCAPGTIDVFAWGDETRICHWSYANAAWRYETWPLTVVRPTPPLDELAQGLDDDPPDYLMLRAADQLLLGLRAPGFAPAADGSAKLVAQAADARLILTFPPQHIAEGVIAAADPTFPPSAITGARLSGPSRIGFVAATGATIELSASGVLKAMRDAAVSTDATATRVEIPYGIAFTPETSGHTISAAHAVQPLALDGTTALWRTELHPGGAAADLQLGHVLAGRDDPFDPPLGKADRFFIKSQATSALARSLALTSLGGSLDASGRWPSYSWDHRAVLGRDQEVRTAIEGVLFPFGHRAVLEQVTQRSATEATAVLRKSRQLIILEPIRRHVDATQRPELINAFPFDGVEIMTRRFVDLDDPDWQSVDREALSVAEGEATLTQIRALLKPLEMAVYGGDMGYNGGQVVEDLALGGNADAVEYIGLIATQIAEQKTIDMLNTFGPGSERVWTYFKPVISEAPIRFPLRCFGESPDVDFDMPLLFVADLDLKGDLRKPFKSLDDRTVLARLQQAMSDSKDGVVPLPGVPINLAPEPAHVTAARAALNGPTASVQFQEVRRINIVGNALAGGFLPTLGLPHLPNAPTLPDDPNAWAADIGMASLRSLLNIDPAVRIHYAADYASSRLSEIPFGIIGQLAGVDTDGAVESLKLDFAKAKDRVGGLAAPNMVADGISRTSGLINTAAQAVIDADHHLDPKTLFAEGASLLGFDLRDLVTDIDLPPQITNLMIPGSPPTIQMNWNGIALKPMPDDDPIFKPDPGSTLDITVLSSAARNETTCMIGGFALVMPPGEPLIQVNFASLKYHQLLGQAPELSVGTLTATLVGKLSLLQTLQDQVSLGDKLPKVNVTATQADATFLLAVPDVQAFSFVLSNLMFSAGLTVPFSPDPVALALGFATRDRPFTLTVLMFGGGGYVDLELTYQGLRRLEISLQFGAAIALNFGIAKAEVHAFGGIRYALLPDQSVSLTGFIHLGGSVALLGLVSVAVELQVDLDYDLTNNVLVGEAKLVIEVDLTLYSHKFELDSGEWKIFGGPPGHQRLAPATHRFVSALPARAANDAGLDAWKAYRGNFA